MGRNGALLPVALAVLSGCRALEVQKFGSARVEKLGAERADAEGLQREWAQTRVRADMAGSFDMFQESEQAWPQTPTVPHAPPALQGGITSDSMAEMQKLLEEKIAAITAEETKRKLKEAM
mmetsp:Transcript_57375/g.152621  ORF Transcript_57375/g.152621 Transcript_57375/m.152621 type:complete len:121 (-) Transcript_57375:166-528(-)